MDDDGICKVRAREDGTDAVAGAGAIRRSRRLDRLAHGRLLAEGFAKHEAWQRLGVRLLLRMSVSHTNGVGFLSVRRVWRARTVVAAYAFLFVGGCVDWALFDWAAGPLGLLLATALLASLAAGLVGVAMGCSTVLDYSGRGGWDSVSNVVAAPRQRRTTAAGLGARPLLLALDEGTLPGRIRPRDRDLALRARPGHWTTREDLHRFYVGLGWQLVPGQDPDMKRPLYVLPVRPPAAGD